MSGQGECDTEQQQASDSSKKQIVPYKAFYQLRNYVENNLGLRRVFIQNLPDQDNLDGCYVGGRIVNVVSSQGGGSMVFVDDGGDLGIETLHGTLKISQELMDQLPSLDSQFRLFVGGASLEKDDEDDLEGTEFTQDTGKNVIVEGSGVTLWVVHPKIDDPKLFQKTSFRPDWWTRAKGKRKRKKRAEEAKEQRKRERLAASEVAGNQEDGEPSTRPGTSTVSNIDDVSRGHEEEGELSCKPGPSNVNLTDDISSIRGEGGRSSSNLQPTKITTVNSVKDGINRVRGEKSSLSKPGSSGISSVTRGADKAFEHHHSTDFVSEQSFPDITDFPDSAFSGSQSPQHMNMEERGGEKESSNRVSSSSSWRESESESDSDGASTDLPEISWSPKKQSKTSYSYTKLGDLQPGLKKVNVIGVVKEFNEPRVTRGTEYCSVLTLLDETDPLVGVKCIMFNSKKERLPHVKREGDIICLHRVNTHDYRNVMQIEGPPYSSSLRFSSEVGRKMKPSTGSLSCTFTAIERRRVRELRQWLQQRRTEHAQRLEAISGGRKCNLLCQVVWIAQLASTNHTILSVWDGSVCPLVIKSFDIAETDICCDAGLNAVIGPKLQQQIVIKSKLSPALKLKPGSYINISNLEASTQDEDGVTELCLAGNPQENIKIIPVSDSGYSELIDRLGAGLASQRVVTVATTVHNDIPLSPLLEVKDYDVEEAQPAKFHCRAKLVRALTPSIEETVRLNCDICGLFEPIPKSMKTELESGLCLDPCPRCSKAGDGQLTASESPTLHCMFLIRVLFADHTASLEVYIPQDEAGAFFGGLKPTNFYQHQSARYQLMSKLYQLSGGNPPFSEEIGNKIRPWIDCCLLKFRVGEEVVYGIFDTTLK